MFYWGIRDALMRNLYEIAKSCDLVIPDGVDVTFEPCSISYNECEFWDRCPHAEICKAISEKEE